jgi:HAD superfamily hydrolase (TIGR01509 family)
MTTSTDRRGCILFDWGDTLMRDNPNYDGPMATWPQVEVVPGAVEALTALKPHWLLAVATNAADSDEEAIWAALRRGGLDRLLDKVYCFRKIGHKKPSQAFFTYILKNLGLKPNAVLMVGDSFELDVLGANQSGIRSVWLNERTPENRSGSMYSTIHTLHELPAAIEELAAK